MEQWHNRLARKLELLGWTAVTLSERSGVPLQNVYKYLQGRTKAPRGDVLKKLAHTIGVTEVWLMHGLDDTQKIIAVRSVPLLRLHDIIGGIPMVDGRIAMVADTVPIPDEPATGDRSFAWRVEDDAISKTPIGSIVIVDMDRPPEPGTYVLAFSAIIKRVVVRRWRAVDYSGAGQLVADSLDFPPLPMSGAEDGYVVGRVVMVISAL